jgi:hypothetical protein
MRSATLKGEIDVDCFRQFRMLPARRIKTRKPARTPGIINAGGRLMSSPPRHNDRLCAALFTIEKIRNSEGNLPLKTRPNGLLAMPDGPDRDTPSHRVLEACSINS